MSRASLSGPEALPVIFGMSGTALTPVGRDFFRETDPLEFIVFARSLEMPSQTRRLFTSLRDPAGRADVPVLIEREGGRVTRLRPPGWHRCPAPATIGALGRVAAREAAWRVARLIARGLAMPAITADCAPVPGTDPVIGGRASGNGPGSAAERGPTVREGLLGGGWWNRHDVAAAGSGGAAMPQ